MTKDSEQYRKSPRSAFIDYDHGDYFITICTKDKRHYFGEILYGEMKLSDIGKFVETQLKNAEIFTPTVHVPQYVVMPNHIHAIVSICGSGIAQVATDDNISQRSPNPSLRVNPASQRHVPALSRYISSLKGSVVKYAKKQRVEFAWQARYHDHLIRSSKDGNMISEYISSNVARWDKDCFYK